MAEGTGATGATGGDGATGAQAAAGGTGAAGGGTGSTGGLPNALNAAGGATGATGIVSGGGTGATSATGSGGNWPDDWRKQASGGDDKLAKRLERYATPRDVVDALANAQLRISRGDVGKVLSENPTEEELKEFREANGIPNAPEGYQFKDLAIADDLKPGVDAYLKQAHAAHVPAKQAEIAVRSFMQFREQQVKDRQVRDVSVARESAQQLRQEYGPRFDVNIQALHEMCESGPTGTFEKLSNARLADGTPLLADADSVRWLVAQALKVNPVITLMGNTREGPAKAMQARIAELESQMGDSNSPYWKNPSIQEEYRNLIDARDRK